MTARAFCMRASLVAGFAMLSACASGGGGGGGSPSPPTQPPTQPPPPPPPPAFAIGAAARATKGNNTTFDVIASAGSADFQSVIRGSVFPLTQSALKLTDNGATPDSAANLSGATVTLQFGTEADARLEIPGLGVNANVRFDQVVTQPDGREATYDVSVYRYVGWGFWSIDSATSPAGSIGHYIMGYQTPAANMPTTGTATYRGVTQGFVFMDNKSIGTVQGAAQVTANFGTSSVTGLLNSMTATDTDTDVVSAWNTVSLQANILSSGLISGVATVATTPPPGTPLALQSTATGFVDGGFYGPTASEIGAVWTLHDGKNTAFGTLSGR